MKLETEADLFRLIADQFEERIDLEYKAAGALAGSDSKKLEIEKDVSSFANSAGGTLIYGMAEFDDDRRHLPERVDWIDRTKFSKERLEQIIMNIRPRLEVRITPITREGSQTDVVYVVKIPQGDTAHQASDCRYWRRHNFIAERMVDHEIRDVMNRRSHPKMRPIFFWKKVDRDEAIRAFGGVQTQRVQKHEFSISVENTGGVVAHVMHARITIPMAILLQVSKLNLQRVTIADDKGSYLDRLLLTNRHCDRLTDVNLETTEPARISEPYFAPILPGTVFKLATLEIGNLHIDAFRNCTIQWETQADNSPVEAGSVPAALIPFSNLSRAG